MKKMNVLLLAMICLQLASCGIKPYKENRHTLPFGKNISIIKAYYSKGRSEIVKIFIDSKSTKQRLVSYSLHSTMDFPFCVSSKNGCLIFAYPNDIVNLKVNETVSNKYRVKFQFVESDAFWMSHENKNCFLIRE